LDPFQSASHRETEGFWRSQCLGCSLLASSMRAACRESKEPSARRIGMIFYALAGINHAADKHRNKLQTFAMVSDLFAAAVLLVSCLAARATHLG
jgi:hypothetical protein